MSKYNLQSVSFALIVLILVLMGQTESTVGQRITAPDDVKETSLIANTLKVKEDNIRTPQFVNSEPRRTQTGLGERLILSLEPEPIRRTEPPPEINASSAYVKELGADRALFEKNIDKRWPLASITKLMTAVIAGENIKPEQKIVINENAVSTVGYSGNFQIGETFSTSDLIKAMLIISSNDAAVALADFYGYEEFINLMRNKALNIGMFNSVFFDPAGLSILNQTTIPDLERLVNYISQNHPSVFEILSERGANILELKSGEERFIPANNRFAGRHDFNGGKTGYTDEARGNLVSIFKFNGKRFLIIVFGTENRFDETEKLYDWLKRNI